jgi:hypothetical protein
MKKLKIVQLVPALLLLTSTFCVNTPQTAAAGTARFHESKSADVTLMYSSWDTILLTKPDSHEDGFYPILTRDNVIPKINHYNTGHDLAVVTLTDAKDMTPQEQAVAIHDWETLLGNCGFHRVVFLSGGRSNNIDGLPIVHDSVIAGVRDDSAKTLVAAATVPSAN